MGIFKRRIFREDKSYDISEALNILDVLKDKGLMDIYTLEPDENENGKYKFIALEISREKEKTIRKNAETKRDFYDRVNIKEQYQNITIASNNNINYKNTENLAR